MGLLARAPVLEAALEAGLGRRYGHLGPDTTDCVRLVLAILEAIYPTTLWTVQARRDLLIRDDTRPWSGLEALVELGLATHASAPVAEHWSVVQLWSGLVEGQVVRGRSTGHCCMWWGGGPGDPSRVLEATTAGPRWYRREAWERRASTHDEVRLVTLLELP